MHPVVGKLAAASGWTACVGGWLRRRHFGPATMARLADAIRASEAGHDGELVLVIETCLPHSVDDGRVRALEVFGRESVWNTERGTGVLLYLALGDHAIELIPDRGIPVPEPQWQAICEALRLALKRGDYEQGLLQAIAAIETLLRDTLPAEPAGAANRLPDAPVLR